MVEISWNAVKQQRRMFLGRVADGPDVSMPKRGTFSGRGSTAYRENRV